MSMKLGCMDCDTCLLTLKAFAGPCMVYANSFNRCFDRIWRCYCWWCRSYRIVSYRRIPFYQVAMTGQLEHHEHDPSDNSGTKPEQPGVSYDLLMLKRPPGPRVRDVPSSTRRLPKKSSSVFRLPAIVTPQRRRLLDGTVLSNRRNGHRDCKRTTKFGLLSRAHVAPL